MQPITFFNGSSSEICKFQNVVELYRNAVYF